MIYDLYADLVAARLAALLKRRGPTVDLATRSQISGLVERHIGRWSETGLIRAAMRERSEVLNNISRSVHIFEVRNRKISVWTKPRVALTPGIEEIQRAQNKKYMIRSKMYRVFLEAAIEKTEIDRDFTFAVDMDDIGLENSDFPIFVFQKIISSNNVLLPDIDFLKWGFYAASDDSRSYQDKQIGACFVGSSSGGWITERTVRNHELPRLRAANYFVNSPNVVFRIASAVQCKTPRAKLLLKQQQYFSSRIEWSEQLAYRFLLSMDGNGAACSRLARALKSNSAVVKFESPYVLYYFPAMVAGRHYIAVSKEREVDELLAAENRAPGHFEPVASAGADFFRQFLNINSILDYTAGVLGRYACLYSTSTG